MEYDIGDDSVMFMVPHGKSLLWDKIIILMIHLEITKISKLRGRNVEERRVWWLYNLN